MMWCDRFHPAPRPSKRGFPVFGHRDTDPAGTSQFPQELPNFCGIPGGRSSIAAGFPAAQANSGGIPGGIQLVPAGWRVRNNCYYSAGTPPPVILGCIPAGIPAELACPARHSQAYSSSQNPLLGVDQINQPQRVTIFFTFTYSAVRNII